LADQLHRIGKQISQEKGQGGRYLEGESENFDCWGDGGSASDNVADDSFSPEEQEETISELMEEVRERINKLRQRGIAEYILEQLLHPDNRLSRMVITKDYRIVLPDYNDMEIKMEPLVKAVYLLFLRHPEGILLKQRDRFRQELEDIYTIISPATAREDIQARVGRLVNLQDNSFSEKASVLNARLEELLPAGTAEDYKIQGYNGHPRRIPLNPLLVHWV
jgi:hypothetical protein